MRLAIALLTCAFLARGQQLAITRVTLIDTETGRTRPDTTVIVSGNRITAVGDASRVTAPPGAQVLDGRGKFLIPGLWDMHVHMFTSLPPSGDDPSGRDFYGPRFVVNGITGVRSMYDNLAAIRTLRASIASGAAVGPRIVASGPILDGPPPYWPGSIACANAEQGREAVDRLKREGADFIKVYSGLPRDAYFAIAEKARKAGLPFAGHLPNSVGIAEASEAGQKSVEHLQGVLAACSTEPKAAALFATFVKNGTWQTPTLTVLRAVANIGDPDFMNDSRLRGMPSPILDFWKAGGAGMTQEDPAQRQRLFQRQLEVVGAMQRAGVKILAGTDTPNPYVFPGSGLHDELELLVKAGLTPLQALQAATLRPAEYLGMTGGLGTIAQGKLADLVLLDGNPLADIANTRRIVAVVFDGKLERLGLR